MKIPVVSIFAYATAGAALEVANNAVEETVVASCFILGKDGPAKVAVCYIVVPVDKPLVKL